VAARCNSKGGILGGGSTTLKATCPCFSSIFLLQTLDQGFFFLRCSGWSTRVLAYARQVLCPQPLPQPLPGFFFYGTGIWTQCLILAREALYHLSHSISPFLRWVFSSQGLSICLGWLQTMILLISVSWVARIIGVALSARPPRDSLTTLTLSGQLPSIKKTL
jgi:hypothetical protein